MTEAKRPLKVFLCHAHADRDAVRALYTRLTNDGVDAWLDKEKLLPGQDWELEIKKAVREADVVVVCLSKQFNQAGFRQKEVRLALDTAMEMPEGEIFIIPARLEECDNLESLRKWHWVDLFEDDGYEMLMRVLRFRAEKIGATWQLGKKGTRLKGALLQKKNISEERVLEAAIEKQVIVRKPASLFVWIRRQSSKNIISVVGAIDEKILLDEENVKAKALEIEFPVENGVTLSAGITLKLIAHEFIPEEQQKKVMVPPKGDSEVCTFIVSPIREGELLLSLEVLKDEVSLANRTLRTTAIEQERNADTYSLVFVTIPIVVFVQSGSSTIEVVDKNELIEAEYQNLKRIEQEIKDSFESDERIRIAKKKIGRKHLEKVSSKKKILLPNSSPLPSFQPSTDWGKVLMWIILIFVCILLSGFLFGLLSYLLSIQLIS